MKHGEETTVNIITPREDIFEKKTQVSDAIMPEGAMLPLYERTDYPEAGGIYVYYKGMKYPKRGFPYPEAVWANDVTKRVIMTMVNTVGMKEMILPFASLGLLPWKKKIKVLEKAIDGYNRIGDWMLGEHFLSPSRYSDAAKSIRSISTRLLKNLGITEHGSEKFGKIFSTMIEYDDAYRFRIQDIMTEANWEQLEHKPITEMKRLASILNKREYHPQVKAKVGAIVTLATIALLHPKIRKAFKKTIFDTTYKAKEDLVLDNSDRYHVLLRGDYDFLGRSFEDRRKIYIDLHTDSKCCRVGVHEYREKGKDEEFYTVCNKCGLRCEVVQTLPPMVQLAGNKK